MESRKSSGLSRFICVSSILLILAIMLISGTVLSGFDRSLRNFRDENATLRGEVGDLRQQIQELRQAQDDLLLEIGRLLEAQTGVSWADELHGEVLRLQLKISQLDARMGDEYLVVIHESDQVKFVFDDLSGYELNTVDDFIDGTIIHSLSTDRGFEITVYDLDGQEVDKIVREAPILPSGTVYEVWQDDGTSPRFANGYVLSPLGVPGWDRGEGDVQIASRYWITHGP